MSSITVGDCVSNLRLWEDRYYTGTSTYFHGAATYTFIGSCSARVSSAKTERNAAC